MNTAQRIEARAEGLSTEQEAAFRLLCERLLEPGAARYALQGYAGTGKTFVAARIAEVLDAEGIRVVAAAPTHRATAEIRRAIETSATIETCTLPSLLGLVLRADGAGGYHLVPDGRPQLPEGGVVLCDEGCLPYTQRIQLADGTSAEIGKVVNQRLDVNVLSYNFKAQQIEARRIVNWFKYRRQRPLLLIKASHRRNRERQRNIRCTPNHEVYLADGRKIEAGKLQVGDKLLVRGRFLNHEQRSFLMGSLLGDASLKRPGSAFAQMSFNHGEDQKAYLLFKHRLFQGIAAPYEFPSGYASHRSTYNFRPPRTENLDAIYDLVYPNDTKTISKAWLEEINPVGLAAWYMDGGYQETYQGGANAMLHTEGFSREQCLDIKDWLYSSWGLYAGVYTTSRGYNKLRLDRSSSERFFDLIAPWTHESMKYKIPSPYWDTPSQFTFRGHDDHGIFPVTAIEPWDVSKPQPFVYDIEVEGNHNYFANNVLISNSMVGEETMDYVKATRQGIRWLFLGDPAQLPPVGEEPSGVFDLPGATLTEIVRQARDNPIIEFSRRIREGLPHLRGDHLRYDGEQGVAVTRSRPAFLESAVRAFQSEAYKEDPTIARVLAYRNAVVDRYNREIRAAIYGEDAREYVPGEWLVARETWMPYDFPVILNSEALKVVSAHRTVDPVALGGEWAVWRLMVRPDGRDKREITVLAAEEWSRYAAVLKRYRDKALEARLNDVPDAASDAWKDFYRLKEQYAQVGYGFASTVHKAQGGTFESIFADYRDLHHSREPERRALKYVAGTRPRLRLALLV